jgi:hypothetical protein
MAHTNWDRSKPFALVPPIERADHRGTVIGAYRAAFLEKHGKPAIVDARVGKSAGELLEKVGGDVTEATAIVRNAVGRGECELHHIARDVTKYRVAPPARASGMRIAKRDVEQVAADASGHSWRAGAQ